jgi:TldD protein
MLYEDVLTAALDRARQVGAQYAEARSERNVTEAVGVRNAAVDRISDDNDTGWGIHVLCEGGWGFASSSSVAAKGVIATAQLAVDIARAAGRHRKGPAGTEDLPTATGSYATELQVDPFTVPVGQRVGLALDASARMLAAAENVKVSNASLAFERHDKLFVNTLGSRLEQAITFSRFDISAVAVDDTGYSYRRSFNDMSQAGWEFVEAQNLPAEAGRVGREAAELVAAPWAPSGARQVIIASDFVSLLVHESCGHPTELDRVLGWEAAFAGRSFLTPDMLGTFQYGSPPVNMTADSLRPGGLGTFGWDEEGTPAQRTEIVRDGVFKDYLTSRESAPAIGQRSNGCGRATSWGRIPIVRMVNLSLEPGSQTLDELLAGVDDGLYVETPSSWSLDDRRMNFHFSAELCREIKGGRLGELRKGAAFQGRTPQFWGAVRAVAGPDEWRLWGFPHCAKGEPLQLCPVSHGASPILVDGLEMSYKS